MTTQDEFENIKQVAIEALEFERNHDSSEMEIWVVKSFLSNLKISFVDNDLIKQEQESKVDIIFKNCRFQLKTLIFHENYRPDDEAKRLIKDIKDCQDIQDVINKSVGSPKDILFNNPSSEILLDRLIKETFNLAHKINGSGSLIYPDHIRSNLDLLLFVRVDFNQPMRLAINFEPNISEKFIGAGWRSVSFLFGIKSLVLSITENAPEFFKKIYLHQK